MTTSKKEGKINNRRDEKKEKKKNQLNFQNHPGVFFIFYPIPFFFQNDFSSKKSLIFNAFNVHGRGGRIKERKKKKNSRRWKVIFPSQK